MKNILNKLKSLSNGLPRSKELAMTSRLLHANSQHIIATKSEKTKASAVAKRVIIIAILDDFCICFLPKIFWKKITALL